MLVTIMRGPPGSGKTWWHNHQLKKGVNQDTTVVDANSSENFTKTFEIGQEGKAA